MTKEAAIQDRECALTRSHRPVWLQPLRPRQSCISWGDYNQGRGNQEKPWALGSTAPANVGFCSAGPTFANQGLNQTISSPERTSERPVWYLHPHKILAPGKRTLSAPQPYSGPQGKEGNLSLWRPTPMTEPPTPSNKEAQTRQLQVPSRVAPKF